MPAARSGLRAAWQDFRRARREWRQFCAQPAAQRALVFYSEGAGYWPHFAPIVQALWQQYQQPVSYLSSQPDDPLLTAPQPGMSAFYLGAGSQRTLAFAGMQAGVVVMTMPDLHSYYIKRSPQVSEYVYVQHSLVSSHMIYRPAAFDHFDSIFCSGPQQIEEIRAREQQQGLPAKTLEAHGYGRLDSLLQTVAEAPMSSAADNTSPHLLIAPSWGDNALLERVGGDFVGALLQAGYRVTLRPHPQTRRLHPALLDDIAQRYHDAPHFVLEEDVAYSQSLLAADLMISDWSGAALEFAFARRKPVLFVDVPRKINNPDYEALGIEPLEVSLRQSLGQVISEATLQQAIADPAPLLQSIQQLLAQPEQWQQRIADACARTVSNPARSGEVAAALLIHRLRKLTPAHSPNEL